MPANTIEGTCRVCKTPVVVDIDPNGGIPVDVHGYNGLTDDGDTFACRDHFCATCGGTHTAAYDFELCEFRGTRTPDLDPPCSADVAYAVLAQYGQVVTR